MEQKKKIKMPNTYTLLFLIIVVIAILTWIIPGGKYQTTSNGKVIAGTYEVIKSNPQGIWDVFMAPINGLLGTKITPGAIDVSFFILMFGGFLGVVSKTGAINSGLGVITEKNKDNETKIIAILMILCAIGGTVHGLGEETIAYLIIILPVMLAMGLDSMVAVSIVLIGSQVGCLASIVNPFATGIASQILGITPGEGIFWRIVMFVILVGISILYVVNYAKKIKKDEKKSYQFYRYKEDLSEFPLNVGEEIIITPKQKKVLIVVTLTFVIMIISLIPWSDLNPNWTFFINLNNWLIGIPFIGKLLGTSMVPLGKWYFREITMLMLFMSIIVGFVYKIDSDELIKLIIKGSSDLLGVAFIVAVARGIQVVMNDGHITATILHFGEMHLSGLSAPAFSILSFIFYIPMSLLIPSSSGLAAATMGIMGPLGSFSHVPSSLLVTSFQSASGFANIFVPTSVIVMGNLAVAHIKYGTWLKFVWKLLAILFIACCIILWLASII